ncbi:MAG: hypothetical protein AUI58_00080 [Chloroflexi bacterium 13_1_40CM_2_70_6]|nr:MAG: hypothetical protein AUI58_00080 [Chloroflexi bacterium 13_1_40CM_2_70_6]
MLTERLHVQISREQRRRLEDIASRRATSMGAVVREAIDARVGRAPGHQRLRAVAQIRAMKGGRFLPPDELDRAVEGGPDQVLRREVPRRRRR